MKVAVSGGGTGGHTLPVLAVIKEINKISPRAEIFFIGSRGGIEASLIPKMGVKYFGISTGKFRRYHRSKILNIIDPTTFANNFRDFFGFLAGIRDAHNVLSYEKPDVLFAKGGFVSLPVGIAARLLGIPIVIHESDAIMGLANQILAKFSNKVCVSFPKKNYQDIKPDKIVVTGNPIRNDILMGNRDSLRDKIGFSANLNTVLVIGGSQGSLFINECILDILSQILNRYQLLWITGEKDYGYIKNQIKKIDKELQKKVKIYGFVTGEMADIYSLADLAVCRSGSNVLFELAAVGLPGVFIPHDVSPKSHQFANAKIFSRSGAGYLIKQDEKTPKKILHQINYLLDNQKERLDVAEKIRKFADIGSAAKVAGVITEIGDMRCEQSRKS